MNLREEILREHSKKQTLRIVDYVGNDKSRFAELMDLFFHGEYRVVQRSAWAMSIVSRKYPQLFEPYFQKALDYLKQPNLHDAVERNILRVVQDLAIPESLRGELVNSCLAYIEEPNKPPAIKAFSISVLENICRNYPELAEEIKVILDQRLPYESPAFQSRAKRFLKKFSR